jgi:adenine-specific DNA-methyltransferase
MSMKGFVSTPAPIVDEMMALLFRESPPSSESTVLDPGCGTGAFIEGIVRWCKKNGAAIPRIVGIESDPKHAALARERFKTHPNIAIQRRDFLKKRPGRFDFIIGNPPYVPITGLSEKEKSDYRQRFVTAVERFDLYLLFFEQALSCLQLCGRLVFITPEKFIYVSTAAPLRRLLAKREVEEIRFIDESAFANLLTYPTITLVSETIPTDRTLVTLRDGRKVSIDLSADGKSWLPLILKRRAPRGLVPLEEVCDRISCGVATGADSVFVREDSSIEAHLRRFAFPTIAGRDLTAKEELSTRCSMLIPYSMNGRLLPEERLGAFRSYLERPEIKSRLMKRTCVARKPWYSFHENPPLEDILRPKILCKDITAKPRFWIDWKAEIVPRHSVYYIVPKNPTIVGRLAEYLNSEFAHAWFRANCQRAANGFLRLQSHVLKRLPIPREFLSQSASANSKADPPQRSRSSVPIRSVVE